MQRIFLFLIVILISQSGITKNIDSLYNLSRQKEGIPSTTSAIKLAAHYLGSDIDSSVYFASKAYHSALKIKNDTLMAKGAHMKALALYYQGNYDSSLVYDEKAFVLYKKWKQYKGAGEVLISKGSTLNEQKQTDKAISTYNLALDYLEKANAKAGIARVNLSIGLLYHDEKIYPSAKHYIMKACESFKKISDTAQFANAITRLGNVYLQTNRSDSANILYLQALELFQKINHTRGVAVIYNNLAGLSSVYSKAQSLDYYQKALEMRTKLGDKNGQCIILHNMGLIYVDEGKTKEARYYLDKSNSMAQEMKMKDILITNLLYYSKLYYKTGNLKEAYNSMEKYAALKDTVYSREVVEKVQEIQTKYETDKKQREIVLLQKENQLKNSELSISKLESQKNMFQKILFATAFIISLLIGIFLYRNNRIIKAAKIKIEKQHAAIDEAHKTLKIKNKIIEDKNNEVMASIHYAARIQRSLITSERYIKRFLNRG